MNNKHIAKYAFYYLLSLAALIFLGISVALIAFGIIDQTVFDALTNSYYRDDGGIKFAISAIFIAGPVYYFTLYFINKGLKNKELEMESPVRRWLTYFIVLVSALIILGTFIGLINGFLSGDLSTKFLLNSLTIFIISALVFSYYFYDIKNNNYLGNKKLKTIFLISSLSLVLIAFVSAWFFIETPGEARLRKLDEKLENNISTVESLVNSYYEKNSQLPLNISDLETKEFNINSFYDPETKEPIEYKKISEDEFELCANFRLSNIQELDEQKAYHYSNNRYQHLAGYYCVSGDLWSNSIPHTKILDDIMID